MGILESAVLQEIGMTIITEDRLVISEHQRLVLRIYIAHQMGLDIVCVTDEIFNAWVSCKEDMEEIEESANGLYECIDSDYNINPHKQLVYEVHAVARFS
jgi:hypothetical protein